MASQVLTYAPSDVKLMICNFIVTGMVSVTLNWNSPSFRIERGIRGLNTRVLNKDLSATLQVELLQTTATNEVLFQLLLQDRNNLSARLDLVLKDQSGNTILYTDSAYVASFPEIRYSSGFDNRVWTIEMLGVVDGNMSNSKSNFDVFGDNTFASDFLGFSN